MSHIKDTSAKIDDLKINISEAVVIHAPKNLDLYFQLYLAILSYKAQKKKKLSTLSKLTKVLEDKQLRLSNKNRRTTNYAGNSKSKKTKLSEQREKRRIKKRFDNEEKKNARGKKV